MFRLSTITNKYKSKRIFFILCFFIIFLPHCISQDSTYVKKFDQDFTIHTSIGRKFTNIGYEYKNNDEITYKPNTPVSIGLGLSWKGTNLSFSYGFDFLRDKDRGKTHSIDFQYHYYGRKIIFDFFFQRYRGFYTDERNDIDISINGNKNDNIKLFPDIKIRQYGVFGQYVFNGKRFSTKAVFNQNEIQRKSTGSLLVGGGIYLNRLQGDSTLYLENADNRIDNFQIGINAGYAYTWVIKRQLFISASFSAGANFGAKSFDRLAKDKLEIYPTIFPRFAMSYKHNSWSIGVSVLVNRVYVLHSKESKVSLDTGSAQITFIKRLDSLPVVSNIVNGKLFSKFNNKTSKTISNVNSIL